jgi:hypothetical protein
VRLNRESVVDGLDRIGTRTQRVYEHHDTESSQVGRAANRPWEIKEKRWCVGVSIYRDVLLHKAAISGHRRSTASICCDAHGDVR